MRVDNYEIVVINPNNGAQYAEREVNGRTYAVVKPGLEYQVMVKIYKPYELFPSDCSMRLNLQIDGQSVGYCRSFPSGFVNREELKSTFAGFCSNGVSESLHAFIFSDQTYDIDSREYLGNFLKIPPDTMKQGVSISMSIVDIQPLSKGTGMNGAMKADSARLPWATTIPSFNSSRVLSHAWGVRLVQCGETVSQCSGLIVNWFST